MVQVASDKRFERKGDDLYTNVRVDLSTAILGGEVKVSTLSGDVLLSVPEGSQPGQMFRLSGRGMPTLKNPKRHGDLFARLEVELPRKLSRRERELFEELRRLQEG